jgi:RNA methyltransferase, TrmH family
LAVLGTDARTFDLENGVMERVASTTTPQPVIAIAERRTSGLAAVKGAQWVVIADRISDPGNLGTILRSAEAAGVSAVVLTPGTVEAFNPKVVRASAGAMFHVPIIEDVSVEEIRDNGFKVFGTSSHDQQGSIDFTTADLTGKIALLVGNEAHGLDDNASVDAWLTIPHRGRSESLNVAMACTLVCFEAARQREGVI